MPVVITPTLPPPDELRIRALNLRTANGVTDTDPKGAAVPAGTILTAAVLGVYSGGVWQYDLPAVTVQDTAAWVQALFQAGDPLAKTAADKFAAADDALKWLCQLRTSQDGRCDRPAA